MTFYLGAPEPSWLGTTPRPLMVSHNRLRRVRSIEGLPVAGPGSPWLLDSGAYDVITRYGAYPDDVASYVRSVRRYAAAIGGLVWAAPQDLPCEDKALAATGLTAREHALASARSYVDCAAEWARISAWPCPFRPVAQGREVADYLACCDELERLGVDVAGLDILGVGSMCRRERTAEIVAVADALRTRTGARLHGYGVKADAADLFEDVDSMAWSDAARHRRFKHPACTAWHRVCTSCAVAAFDWHDRALADHPRHAA